MLLLYNIVLWSCPIIFNRNTIEITVHTSCYLGLIDLLCVTVPEYGCRISFINGPIRSVCDRGKGRFSNAFSDISQHVLNKSCLFFSLSKLCRKQILNCTASLVWSLYHPSESQILTLATDSQVSHLTLLFYFTSNW